MEQLVILVIIGLISLVNWLMQRSAELKKQRRLEEQGQEMAGEPAALPRTEPSRQAEPARDPSVEMRRLMEALGIPMEEEPPALPELPRSAPEPVPPPPVVNAAPPQPVQIPAPAVPAPAPSAARSRSALSQALKSRDGLREAVVLREILGPPKAWTL